MSEQTRALRRDAAFLAWGEPAGAGTTLETLCAALAAKHPGVAAAAIEYFARVALQGEQPPLEYRPRTPGAPRTTGVAPARVPTELDKQILDLARSVVSREPGLARDHIALRRAVETDARAESLDTDAFPVRQAITDAVMETWIRVPEPYRDREDEREAQTERCATAERALIGAILCQPPLADVILPEVPAEDIRDPSCRAVWTALQECREAQQTCDPVTVLARLRASGAIAVAGGGVFLAECMDHVAAPSFWATHAKIVRDAGVHRRASAAGSSIVAAAQSDLPADDVVTAAEKAVDSLGRTLMASPMVSASSAVQAVMAPLSEGSRAVTTGLRKLDVALGGGLHPGNMVVIAGRPGTGKSALGAQIAVTTAWRGGAVCFVSLEMTASELAERAALGEANVDGEKWRARSVNQTELESMFAAASDLAKLRLWFVDDGTLTVSGMRRRVMRLHAEQGGLALVVVDYVQLLSAGEELPRGRSREQEVAHASRALKALAKDLGAPVLVLAQLNRDLEKREQKRPQLSDLRESGSLEQDADVVLLLHREEMHNPQTERRGEADIIVAKARAGRRGVATVGWQGNRTRFVNLSQDGAA